MSASKEKQKRREERVEGIEKKQVLQKNNAKAKRRSRIIKTVAVTATVIILVVLVIFNSTLFYSGIPAVHIGDYNYTTAEFNYFYQSAYITTYLNFGDWAPYMIDTNVSLKKQQYSEDMTWAAYFENQALETMRRITLLVDEAKKEGYTLPEEGVAEIESTISEARSVALSNNYGSLANFLTSYYSKGLTEKAYRALVEKEITAKYYAQELLSRPEFTDEEKLVKYGENTSTYNLLSYCIYYVDGSVSSDEDLSESEAMNNAYLNATALAGARTEDIFEDMILGMYPDADVTSVTKYNVSPSNVRDYSYSDWLVSHERKFGDTEIFESGNGYYVLLFLESNNNSYLLQNFRHILVNVEIDPDYEDITAYTIHDAENKINEIRTEWMENPTEEHFAELANEMSGDPGSNENGGLYDNVSMGVMVPEIENWLFDPVRKVGDTEVIYVKSANYTGYHLIYYMEPGDQYNLQIAEGLLKQDWYKEWEEARFDYYKSSTTIAFMFSK